MFTNWDKAEGEKRAEGRNGGKRNRRESMKIETQSKIAEIVQITPPITIM